MTNSLSWLLVMLLRSSLVETIGERLLPGFQYASYEMTIPRKLASKPGNEEPEHVSYLLQIEGIGHVVELRQERGLIPKHFPVFSYNEEGDLQVDQPFIRDDCFYSGFVQSKPSSLVTCSFCSGGLRGILKMENKTYEIEPVEASSTFQHVVYSLEEDKDALSMRCGLTEEEEQSQEAVKEKKEILHRSASVGNWWPHTRYAEIAFVIDHQRYLKFNKNETLIALQVINIVHVANTLYQQLSIKLSVAGLEIWSQKNAISISKDIRKTLKAFTIWRSQSLLPRLGNDATHLFAYFPFNDLGLAYVGGICSENYGSAVEQYITSSLYTVTLIFSHELGHNLGMTHDGKYCKCQTDQCIMVPSVKNNNGFSNCSYKDYFKYRNKWCLLVPPDPKKTYKIEYCGNKIVEAGEQCDCGSEVQCRLHPCCQSNCKLRHGAACAFGLCCQKCQYRQAGTVCREMTSSCDLPEFCNGTSELCPEDVYVQDGTPCSSGEYCYHGNCNTHNVQCKMIFGSKARVASEVCFRETNAKGDRFGNCGLNYTSYKKCKDKDILCGRIQCENVEILPYLQDHSTVVQASIGNKECWSTDYHYGMGIKDIGAVMDSTPCGNGMMCIDQKCVSVSSLMYDCNVTKCNNRGICNNHKHCHCNYGWEPPDCRNKGYGGSINSGPPPQYNFPRTSEKTKVIGGLIYTVSAAIIFGAVSFYSKDQLRLLFRKLKGRIYPTASKEGQGQP